MNIHFHRLLDRVRVVYDQTIGQQVSKEKKDIFFEEIQRSAKFVFDEYPPVEIEDFGRELAMNGLMELPFDRCYFEYPFEGRYFGLFCFSDGAKVTLISAVIEGGAVGAGLPFRFDLALLRERLRAGGDYMPNVGLGEDEELRKLRECQRTSIREMLTSVAMLSAKGVRKENVEPSETVNAQRRKQGKRILPAYTIVRLYGLHRSCGTGTHSSPRPHMRRGHVRSLASGRNVIVRPHFVMADPGSLPTYRIPKH